MSAQSSFWNDARLYSISMIGAPGVPIPAHRTSKYSVTTGSEAEDRELRRMVSLEIDESRSQLVSDGRIFAFSFKARLPNPAPGSNRAGQTVTQCASSLSRPKPFRNDQHRGLP